jgi:hypothetical protein
MLSRQIFPQGADVPFIGRNPDSAMFESVGRSEFFVHLCMAAHCGHEGAIKDFARDTLPVANFNEDFNVLFHPVDGLWPE